MTRTNSILTLSNGRGIDLLGPKASDIDFISIAEHLAKEPRYNGATPGVVYSVAEHSARGVRSIMVETGDEHLAAYFLLHDCHEAFLKDDTTPKKRALGIVAEEAFGVLASSVMDAFDRLTDRFDAAVHEAAGMPWPPAPDLRDRIKYWDLRMFVTEWRDLMSGIEHPEWDAYRNVVPLPQTIAPWAWRHARHEFLFLCDRLLPAMKRGDA